MTFFQSTVSPTTDGSGSGLTLKLTITWQTPLYDWNAKWTIENKGDDYKVGDTITIPKPAGLNANVTYPASGIDVKVTGIGTGSGAVLKDNLNQLDAIADYVQFPGMEQKSHQDGPEHEIVYVNELTNPGSSKASYMDLAIGGIRINSAKEWTNFTQLSAYFKKIGLKEKERVAAYVPNSIEAVVSFLASSKNGLVWSSCSPDFGEKAVIDRFKQIEPKIIFTSN